MTQLKYALFIFVFFSIGMVFAQNVAVNFKDASGSPLTKTAIDREFGTPTGYPNGYPQSSPVGFSKWRFQWYKDGGDNIISPLNADGSPSGDDILSIGVTNPGFTSGVVTLSPGTSAVWAPSAATFADQGGAGNTWKSDKVFLRIFNASTIELANKSMAFTSLYTITTAGTQTVQPYIPTYGWSSWVTFRTITVNPAVLVYPTPSGITGIGFSSRTLSWTAGTGTTPSGYKVYFGTDGGGTTTPSNIVNGATQTGTTYVTGVLTPETTYYWKIVPYAGTTDATDCPIWSFTTRPDVDPYAATNPIPIDGEIINTLVYPYNQTLSWSAPVTGITPTGYKLFWEHSNDATELGNVLTTSVQVMSAGEHYWQIVPYYNDPGNRSISLGEPVPVRASNTTNQRGDAQSCPIWSFISVLTPSYTVEITSNPSDADIYIGGVDSGFNTPHTFTMTEGFDATYTVQKTGYSWSPNSFPVTNIHANTSQLFTGTLLTYTVDIASTPSNIQININGVDSHFSTPHQFVMNYGTSATYTVLSQGYTWSPESFVVNNIQANTSQTFTGTLNTYTVDITSSPSGAAIYSSGINTGFTTPHTYTMNYYTSNTFTVQLTGYSWSPSEFVITNIQGNTSQNFTGTLLTYTVEITSIPSDADIYISGIDSGYNTPHTFTMNYGTGATYTVQKAGFTFDSQSFAVSNISANTNHQFTGTALYTVDITSNPSDADIFVGGVDTGFNTPHQFILTDGSSATYSVQKTGYNWSPAEFTVTNIHANTSQDFTGSLKTYTVDITSTPSGAYINAVGSRPPAYTTPHQFIMEYGSSATYFVTLPGYSFNPVSYTVTNIQENKAQDFVGTINTYSVDVTSSPSDADIYVDGIDSGYNTPHTFMMNYHTSATFKVKKDGYDWTPDSLAVSNIQANTSQSFSGTLRTYTVDITSTPSDADIFIGGVDSGYNTPHSFSMEYGSSAIYTVGKEGYNFSSQSYAVSNITANSSHEFAGTILTFTVDITSVPSGATILVNNSRIGMYTTPHQFVLDYGTSVTYSVEMPGYTWSPVEYHVTNINSNRSQEFIGTINTYTVDITSTPSDANIFVGGVDSGYNTPHTFTMNYYTSATYTVEKAGYSFSPTSFPVNYIQANTSQNFTGTLLTYTVEITSTPSDADIFIDNVDSGYNTPHTFTMNYGTSAVYSVQKTDYGWAPATFAVNNIAANTSQNFVGSLGIFYVDVTSVPAGANILLADNSNGSGSIDSGFVTPYQFRVAQGTTLFISLSKTGYTWEPSNYFYGNIHSNQSAYFVGSLIQYSVDITSVPSGAKIYKGGIDTGFTTPHTFTMDYGTNATYTIQKAGYTFSPQQFQVQNISDDMAQEFIGTIITYTVDITSSPSGAYINVINNDITRNEIDIVQHTTPYQFVVNWGSSYTYSVNMPGYTFTPVEYVADNIQENKTQNFVGTINTYFVDITSSPNDADIYVDGIDSGYNTPHTFMMDYNTSAVYSVHKIGFNWEPVDFAVNNIRANTSQNFTGTLITYTVDIASSPSNADIFEGGVDTGFNTPHQFVLGYGSNANYTVQKAGYSWSPSNLQITNIQANASQTFTGSLLTYTVDITSTPSGASILVPLSRDDDSRVNTLVDTGFTTPHQFTLNYGSSQTYYVEKPGYTWAPYYYMVSNIHANAAQNFVGTMITYTVNISSTPADADIYIDGVDSGYNSPHTFTMNYGSSAVYTVQKTGYSWDPASYNVTNIHANASQAFNGTLLTYTVNISSEPTSVGIYRNGDFTGFVTPHTFTLNHGDSGTYSVYNEGYTWVPDNLVITGITGNLAQNFIGTLMTFNVTVTSTPSGAEIFQEYPERSNDSNSRSDTGFTTPHTFVLEYGTSCIFYVEKPGFSWTPEQGYIEYLTQNTNIDFTGTLNSYEVSITSEPSGATIFRNGQSTGFLTPQIFTMDWGTSAVYTVEKEGFDFAPANFVIENITESCSENFIGTLKTYTVEITSYPSGAEIYTQAYGTIGSRDRFGFNTGFTTPHTFVLNYGSYVTYYVEKPGYTWAPEVFAVNYIQANTSQNFIGTLLTYNVEITSTPSDADILIGGVDTGYNTPHTFVMNWGTSGTYTVQKAGYTWAPNNFIVTNIQSDTAQAFIGTLIPYNVNIASTPSDADIYLNGQDTGFNTPHQFVMNWGTSGTYTVQKAGYTWVPESYTVTNIQANANQTFIGTLIPYTVDVNSNPPDADIYLNGQDTGYNTPHQFVMNYGTSATYTVQKAGYTWSPNNFVVSNIQANTSTNFAGTIITYTVSITSTPSNTDIYENGHDTGQNTPHTFTINYGTSTVYSVVKDGYYWNPTNLIINNIQANTSQNFAGTLITYTVEITSNPTDADIYDGGIDTGYNTPHTFVLAQGAGAVYTVQKAGYAYSPNNFTVTNIHANTSQAFTGTLLTYSVNVTSAPENADILVNGVDSGFNTPHVFTMNYGTSATYSAQKEGYTWQPASSQVTNIQSNKDINFVGTIITYTVDILSNPTDADIYINGQDTGFNTPHQFVMNYGTSSVYTIQKAGYTWNPASFAVNNIHANTAQLFTGTIITYTVDITSAPSDADILVNGVDTGFNTPHQFIMNYGTNATYSVQKTGYAFTPQSFVVSNIQNNQIKNFNGALLTYTVEITSEPANADIFVNGTDSGYDTPYTFTMNYGSSAVYMVQKAGYIFTPTSYPVNNITANTGVNFTGTILTYDVEITSVPSGTDIYVNGVDSGFNTPYTFTMTYGTSATYTLQRPGYTWLPSSFIVNNIQESLSRNFVGSQITYTVSITSTPSNADVFIGNEDTGLNTPCQLVLPHGSNATIRVHNIDYAWAPESFVITNLQANTSQNFVGTLLTYAVNVTSNPSDVDIYVNGQDSGFNTPHTFVMNSGTNAVYSVQKQGYSWNPPSASVYGIHANTNLQFNGSLSAYSVNITSNPINADIFVNGVDSGFNTPYEFFMDYGSSATYSVQKEGYIWQPNSFTVTNIQSNTSQSFTGTAITFTANITSNPSDADIFVNGIDSGFNTPHTFTMNYGSDAVYSVQKEGYVWQPETFAVTNIHSDTAQLFVGSTRTYTVSITSNPTNADIYIGGIDSGFNTPHVFTMNHGASATYSVQQTGYMWSPASFPVVNIQSNISQNFVGTQFILVVSPANHNVPSQAGSTNFTVNSNIAWTVTETESWLSVSPLNSVNNGEITVLYDANTSSVMRVGTITVTGNNIIRTITVSQAAGQIYLNASPAVQNVGYAEGVTSFEIQSNVAWSVNESSDWFSVAPLDGSNDGSLTVAYNENLSPSSRSAIITITGNNVIRTVTVTQEGRPEFLTIANPTQNVGHNAAMITFEINSNIDWSVDESIGWLSVSPSNGSHNGFINVNIQANPVAISRSGQFTISGGNLSQTITVIQDAAPVYMTVTPQIQYVTNYEGSTAFTITSNGEWTVSESVSWLSVNQVSGSMNGTFDIVYEANAALVARTGTVTITCGSITRTVNIVQSAGVNAEDPTEVPFAGISVYPNPFAASANIKLDVTNNNNAELAVYSSKGELIRKLGNFPKGSYTINWDGKDKAGRQCSNGFYLIRYKSTDLTKSVKVLMMHN